VREPWRAVAAAIVANVLGGTSYVLTKVALAGLTETTLVVVRTLVALAVLVPLAGPPLAALLRASGADRARLVVMGAAGYALPLVLASYGIRHSTATNASLLIGVEPLGIAFLGVLVLRERLGRARVLALALGVVGATVLVVDGIPLVTMTYAPHPVGDLILVAAGLAWAPYTVAGKQLLARYDPIAVSAASLVVALPCLLPVAAVEAARAVWVPAAIPAALAVAAVLGLVVSAGMTVLWNAALGGMDASRLAGFVFLQPLAGVALGAFVVGEPVGRYALLGGALVLAAVYVLIVEERALASSAVRSTGMAHRAPAERAPGGWHEDDCSSSR
jgi:drug/metabolite transporter (DMT)-like permease